MDFIKRIKVGLQKKVKGIKKEGEKQKTSVAVIKLGPNRTLIRVLWGVLIISIFFGVYKNFTAVDKETIYETKVIEEKLVDTNAVESYVKSFARIYHSWGNTPEAIKERKQALNGYLTEELLRINEGTVTTDCPTIAVVRSVDIWSLEEKKEGEYKVEYSVTQLLQENEEKNEVAYAFQVTVHVDQNKTMVVVRNPTMCSLPEKSGYAPAEREIDGSINGGTKAEIEEFLNTFFSLYPKATEKELQYYVKDGVLDAIQENLVYAGLIKPVYYMDGSKVRASIYVQYLDQTRKITHVAQYQLTLEKGDNWKIAAAE